EILRNAILADPSDYGADLAVAKIFVSYQPGAHKWKQLRYPNERWLTCETEATVDHPLQTVHINLLNGDFRVDGQPFGGLPREIRDSLAPDYQQIFRDQGFFVIPSNLLGMDFTTFAMMPECKVHFSLPDDSVVIRMQDNRKKDILELIPSSTLLKDLPKTLVDDHVHLLNLTTKIIEIRPLEQLWEESSEHWRIDCASGQYRMYRGDETVVDSQSSTYAMVSKCFESRWGQVSSRPEKLLITTSPIDSASMPQLSVTLPYYDLSFFVNDRGELESREFKDMVYDENQCVGTLLGLRNILVLRPKTHITGIFVPEALTPRRVLIPHFGLFSSPNWVFHTGHHSPLYYTYNVDTELGCLIGNGSLTSTEFLARLHAMTSYHRPDPLTGKTGAQAAISLLQSAGCCVQKN
ncbi:hypothetical protein OG21DRAFT_1528184, partial [Imleria badia]